MKEKIIIEKQLIKVMVDTACVRCGLNGDCIKDFDCVYEYVRRDYLK